MKQPDLHTGLRLLARRTRVLTLLTALFSLDAAALGIGLVLSRFVSFSGPAADAYAILSGTLELTFVSSMIIFVLWVYRAQANLVAAGIKRLRYTPARAVACFFLPFGFFYKPMDLMQDLLDASRQAQQAKGDAGWLVTIWWGMALAGLLLSNIAADMPSTDQSADLAALIGLSALLVSAGCLVWLVQSISKAQAQHLKNHAQAAF